MSKKDYTPGTSSVTGFFAWINERTEIWWKRQQESPAPWTDDKILQEWKFTNAYRQCDRGTIALKNLLASGIRRPPELPYPQDYAWTIWWYRLFNLDTHANHFISCKELPDYDSLTDYIRRRKLDGEKIFTGAHMTSGLPGQQKHETYLHAARQGWDARTRLVELCRKEKSMEAAFYFLMKFPMIGKFIAYEMVCDLRFTKLLCDATDINEWSNVGPGAKRGMERLGLEPSLDTMVQLHALQDRHLASVHENVPWPFELREIEHSLCEFDKYERVRLEQGRPRQKYDGTGD